MSPFFRAAVFAIGACATTARAAEPPEVPVAPDATAASTDTASTDTAASPQRPAPYDPARSFAPLVDAVTPAVVSIEVEGIQSTPADIPEVFRRFFPGEEWGPRVVQGTGSGFIISPEGLVLTNHHVVQGARKIEVTFADGTFRNARVLGTDAELDLALLLLPDDRAWPWVELGSSDGVRVGDRVVAVGNPLDLGITVTMGIVSGKGRSLETSPYDDYLQTDAAINPGNSGGPLFDLDGRVVGVNTAIIEGANTVGFAVPIDVVRAAVPDLQTSGRVVRGFLGVSTAAVTIELRDQMRLDGLGGALVTDVYEGTPAARAGLREGDLVVAIDAVEVKTPTALTRAIAGRRPGERVELQVVRDGKKRAIPVELQERPD